MNENKLRQYLANTGIECNLIFLSEIDSTNDFAKENLILPPAVIISPSQRKGRGRFNNKWFSDEGKNITMTIVPELLVQKKDVCVINFYTGVAIYNVLSYEFPELKISLKWPNDIIINGKKCGGILTEVVKRNIQNENSTSAENDYLIVGVGLNVNQENFPVELKSNKYQSKNATSLFIETGKVVGLEQLVSKILKEFFIYYDAVYCPERVLYLWKMFSGMIGKDVEFFKSDEQKTFKGNVFDIEIDGSILILLDNKEKVRFYSGEVHLIY